jgi:hypothetical protein
MNLDEKREGRINMLHQKALNGKFTNNGRFSYTELVAAAKIIGVTKQTAQSYADTVIDRLKKGGHLR